uniref:Uncharacterized protein n=1 Tax=Arundo donax TaxID=35708 RepID=A0A0A9E7S3_ARUDO
MHCRLLILGFQQQQWWPCMGAVDRVD